MRIKGVKGEDSVVYREISHNSLIYAELQTQSMKVVALQSEQELTKAGHFTSYPKIYEKVSNQVPFDHNPQ